VSAPTGPAWTCRVRTAGWRERRPSCIGRTRSAGAVVRRPAVSRHAETIARVMTFLTSEREAARDGIGMHRRLHLAVLQAAVS